MALSRSSIRVLRTGVSGILSGYGCEGVVALGGAQVFLGCGSFEDAAREWIRAFTRLRVDMVKGMFLAL